MLNLYKKYDEKFVLDNLMGPNSLDDCRRSLQSSRFTVWNENS
ncbi:hypothetical protein [Clostridium estertheticum]|nr:hypothetical protein [Clostridium estertheticum]